MTARRAKPYRLESVDGALRMLLLLQEDPELRVTTAAERLGVAPSTAHRLLATLEARRFVTQDRVTRVYRAGPALFELGTSSANSFELRRAAEPHLRQAALRLGETVHLLVLEGAMVSFVAGVASDRQPGIPVLTGAFLPAYAASGGKVLLSELPRETLRELYPRGVKKLTPSTQTFTKLMEELSMVMMHGYAVNRGESDLGLSAVAVPVRGHAGRAIAAVAMAAPNDRANAMELREIVVELRECARLVRAALIMSGGGLDERRSP